MTGLFGGALGTPAQRQEAVLRRDLELRYERWDGPPSGPGAGRHDYLYRGGADYCLMHGKFRPGRVLPPEFEPVWKLSVTCFLNALEACRANANLRYCEGYCNVGHGNQITHAWCIGPDDGVVEVTYPTDTADTPMYTTSLPTVRVLPPQHWGYWGVIFPLALVEFHNREPLHLPFLDRPRAEELEMAKRWDPNEIYPDHDHPILKVPHNPERTTL